MKILEIILKDFQSDEYILDGTSMLQLQMINGVKYNVETKIEDEAQYQTVKDIRPTDNGFLHIYGMSHLRVRIADNINGANIKGWLVKI